MTRRFRTSLPGSFEPVSLALEPESVGTVCFAAAFESAADAAVAESFFVSGEASGKDDGEAEAASAPAAESEAFVNVSSCVCEAGG